MQIRNEFNRAIRISLAISHRVFSRHLFEHSIIKGDWLFCFNSQKVTVDYCNYWKWTFFKRRVSVFASSRLTFKSFFFFFFFRFDSAVSRQKPRDSRISNTISRVNFGRKQKTLYITTALLLVSGAHFRISTFRVHALSRRRLYREFKKKNVLRIFDVYL